MKNLFREVRLLVFTLLIEAALWVVPKDCVEMLVWLSRVPFEGEWRPSELTPDNRPPTKREDP